jgi:16S rRNA (adenine1518-N6/adenine1519-N6)-dimethyltransferase
MSPVFGKRRALGQHFLRDHSIIDRIARTGVEEAMKAGCQALLEIGPGKGAITHPIIQLLEKGEHPRRFMIVERDRQLAYEWRGAVGDRIERLGGAEAAKRSFDFVVEEGDFVELPEERWLDLAPLAIVSNLPYSAGTAILQRLARKTREIPVMVLMFQAEVAYRLRAEQGTKSWGSLSIWIQNHWDVTKLCSAPPGAFVPPPDVDSEVVILRRRDKPRIEVSADREPQWEGLLKAAFQHRRKMLRSGLLPNPRYREALDRSGLDPTLRAEALTWEQWAQFFAAVAP